MKIITTIILYLAIFFSSIAPGIDKRERQEHIQEVNRLKYEKFVIAEIESKADVVLPDDVNIDHVVYMYDTAVELDLPIRIIFRLINQESGFKEEALSHKGAYGYMQLMPATYWYYHEKLGFGFIEEHSAYKNIYIGLYMLNELADIWGNWDYVLASYNAGIGRVIQYGGIPPFQETQHFVRVISA